MALSSATEAYRARIEGSKVSVLYLRASNGSCRLSTTTCGCIVETRFVVVQHARLHVRVVIVDVLFVYAEHSRSSSGLFLHRGFASDGLGLQLID